jgi:hypothetical protein
MHPDPVRAQGAASEGGANGRPLIISPVVLESTRENVMRVEPEYRASENDATRSSVT